MKHWVLGSCASFEAGLLGGFVWKLEWADEEMKAGAGRRSSSTLKASPSFSFSWKCSSASLFGVFHSFSSFQTLSRLIFVFVFCLFSFLKPAALVCLPSAAITKKTRSSYQTRNRSIYTFDEMKMCALIWILLRCDWLSVGEALCGFPSSCDA